MLGIGFGWNREEAADHGVAFGSRRAVAREHMLCMQALWSEDQGEFHGEFVSLDPCWSWPKPIQQPTDHHLDRRWAPTPRSSQRWPSMRMDGCRSEDRVWLTHCPKLRRRSRTGS